MPISTDNLLLLLKRSDELRALVDGLRNIGYSSQAVANAFGMKESPRDLLTNTAYCALAYYDAARASSSPVAVLGAMFSCGGWIEKSVYERTIPAHIRAPLGSCGLVLEAAGNFVRASVGLHEFGSQWIFSDALLERSPSQLRLAQDFPEHVDPPNYSSLSLLRNIMIQRQHDRRILDIGCGSGIQSIVAAKSYSSVVGIDVTERTMAFSKLNASVNDVAAAFQKCDCMSFQESEQFDRILFNCPSVPRYRRDLDKIDTYTSPMGHELVIKFLQERLEALLSPVGIAEIWSIFAVEKRVGSVADLLVGSVQCLNHCDVEIVVEANSPFGLSRRQITERSIPRNSFLLASPDDAGRLLAFVHDRQIDHIAPALVRIQRRVETRGRLRLREVETLLQSPQVTNNS